MTHHRRHVARHAELSRGDRNEQRDGDQHLANDALAKELAEQMMPRCRHLV